MGHSVLQTIFIILYGRPFQARSDHRCLKWLRTFKEPKRQVARWIEMLQEYDFEVLHRPGQIHSNADALSRKPCKQCGIYIAHSAAITGTLAASVENTWLLNWSNEELLHQQQNDPDITQVLNWLEDDTLPETFPSSTSHAVQSLWSQTQQLVVKDQLFYRIWEDVAGGGANRRQLYILPHKLVPIVLKQLHDASTAGHLGVQKTLGKLKQRFYWVGQRKDVEEWCHHCDICASRKFPLKHPKAPLVPSFISNPLDRIAIDILGSLPTTP